MLVLPGETGICVIVAMQDEVVTKELRLKDTVIQVYGDYTII